MLRETKKPFRGVRNDVVVVRGRAPRDPVGATQTWWCVTVSLCARAPERCTNVSSPSFRRERHFWRSSKMWPRACETCYLSSHACAVRPRDLSLPSWLFCVYLYIGYNGGRTVHGSGYMVTHMRTLRLQGSAKESGYCSGIFLFLETRASATRTNVKYEGGAL